MTDIEKSFFDKIPVDKVYKDLFQPGMKKAGQALETVIEFGLTILLPIKLLNEKSRARLKAHLEKFNKKLEGVEEAKICQVPEHVGLPIIDKLTYLNQQNIADAFINLLTKASSIDTINLVHPAFLLTLENLCSDEAKILLHYKETKTIPFIDIIVNKWLEKIPKPDHFDIRGQKTREQLKQSIAYSSQFKNAFELKAPSNIDIYLDNLTRQGLIAYERNLFSKSDESIYEELESKIYRQNITEIETSIQELNAEGGDYKSNVNVNRGQIHFTDFGKAFIDACIKD